ncbi:MAG: hypothetical protein LBP28_07855 [Coriobacteriales bacterium]|nr:hypothetical protein [Coriobacteriales bacterium]
MTFVSTISLLLLSAVLALIVGISAFAPAFAGSISDIEVATQQTSGATTTNYMPILAEGINWADLSDDERAGTARYAVNSAAKLAEQNGVTDFNVMGISPTDKQPVFLYTGGKTLSIHLDGTSQTISLNE